MEEPADKILETFCNLEGGNRISEVNHASNLIQTALESVKLTHDATFGNELLSDMVRGAANANPRPPFIDMMPSAGLGKLFAPPPGDWRRSSG